MPALLPGEPAALSARADTLGSYTVTQTPLKHLLGPTGVQTPHLCKSKRNRNTVSCQHWLTLLPRAWFSNKQNICFRSWKCKVSHKKIRHKPPFLAGSQKICALCDFGSRCWHGDYQIQRSKKMTQAHDLLKRKQEKTLLPPFCFTHICLQDQIGFQPLKTPVSASFFKLWAPPPLQSMPRPVSFRNKTVLWKSLLLYYYFAPCDKISLPIYTVPHKLVVKVRCRPRVVPLLSAHSGPQGMPQILISESITLWKGIL